MKHSKTKPTAKPIPKKPTDRVTLTLREAHAVIKTIKTAHQKVKG